MSVCEFVFASVCVSVCISGVISDMLKRQGGSCVMSWISRSCGILFIKMAEALLCGKPPSNDNM